MNDFETYKKNGYFIKNILSKEECKHIINELILTLLRILIYLSPVLSMELLFLGLLISLVLKHLLLSRVHLI